MHIEDLLREVVSAQASDLHMTSGIKPTMRLWGRLIPMEHHDVLTAEDTFQLAYSMLNTFQKQKFEKVWELDLSYGVPGLGRFRVNIYRQRGAVGIAIRVIPMTIPSVEALNLPVILKELTRKPRGLVLVTGPTGHGKSTTLASMIDFINTERSAHIVTVEDPIEYLHQHKRSMVNQRELGFDTQSFPSALRAVLREDPNVVLIGEMRDLETISTAITAAETGHLVLATLHTVSAAQTVDRIVDVFPPHQQAQVRMQLSTALEGVLSQALLPRTEGRGRVAALEVMVGTTAVRNLVREGKTHQITSTIQAGARDGMQTLNQALRHLVKERLVAFEVAMAHSSNPQELAQLCGRDSLASAAL